MRPSTEMFSSALRPEALRLVDHEHVLATAVARHVLPSDRVDVVAADEHRPKEVGVVAADTRQVDQQDLAAVHEVARPDRRDALADDRADRLVGDERTELVEHGLDRGVPLALARPRPLGRPEGLQHRVGKVVYERRPEDVVGQDPDELEDRLGALGLASRVRSPWRR